MIDTYEMINNPSLPMSDETRLNMSARMQRLMRESAGLDTNEKVAERSGVSYGTVRRIRVGDVTFFNCRFVPYASTFDFNDAFSHFAVIDNKIKPASSFCIS